MDRLEQQEDRLRSEVCNIREDFFSFFLMVITFLKINILSKSLVVYTASKQTELANVTMTVWQDCLILYYAALGIHI